MSKIKKTIAYVARPVRQHMSVKQAIVHLARPVWRRVSPKIYSRVDMRIDMRLAQLDVGWKQHVPAFLNAVSSVQSLSHNLLQTSRALRSELAQSHATLREELASVRDTLTMQLEQADKRTNDRVNEAFDRVEFIRSEILYEMKFGAGAAHVADPQTPRQAILAPEKIEAAQANGGLRLNLGCGHISLDDYINVDMRELPTVDVVADVRELPFEPGSVREIRSAHLLEHFPQQELTRRLLPYWHSLLTDGGSFRAIVPDGAAMLQHVTEGSYPFEQFREVLFGAQDYDGDFHYNMLTPESLSELLQRAGFRNVQVPVRGRPNGKCFEFEACAVK